MNAFSGTIKQHFKHPTKCLLAFGIFAIVTGCTDLRKVTYPAEFVYLEKQQVQGVMHQLAGKIRNIESLASDDVAPSPFVTDSITAGLSDIESTISDFQSGAQGNQPLTTNHLLLDENLDEFLADITRAKIQLQANPPNYFAAGRIAGSCAACHTQ